MLEVGGDVSGGGGVVSVWVSVSGGGTGSDEEGGGVSPGSAGKVTVTPLTTAETMPSGDWPRIRTSSPGSMKRNGRQSNVTKENGLTY